MQFNGTAAQWNQFFLNRPSQAGIFLQSWEWGEFVQSCGGRVFRFDLGGVHVQVFEKSLPLGLRYWYAPRAILDKKRCEMLIGLATQAGAVFVRVESMSDETCDGVSVASVQPAQTHIVPLDNDSLMLERMHSKTRYNIRLAQRKGVKVVFSKDYLKDFLRLIHVTRDRNQFGIHSDAYYAAQIKQDDAYLVVGKYENQVIAAHIYWLFGDTLTYVHGASANEHRHVMAPYAVHWEACVWARDRGAKRFDLWGIDDVRWPALTAFKRRFGGCDELYPPCVDVPVRRGWYGLYRLARRFRGSW